MQKTKDVPVDQRGGDLQLSRPINVTKVFLPPVGDYVQYLNGIYDRQWVTNQGPLAVELEARLRDYLDVAHLAYVSNGTIALQIAIKALDLHGEIITTPFSYVATTSSIVWEGCTPVFADIDPGTFNIDPAQVETLITDRTTAILATHVFGNPCDIRALEAIAEKRNIKIIYDAAHCFGTSYDGRSVFNYGDISTTSFHATKLFHTIEGGAVFAKDRAVLERMLLLRNFGHISPVAFNGVGVNGKNSEFHAAMGLCNLSHINAIREARKRQWKLYQSRLAGTTLQLLQLTDESGYNYSYFPVVLQSEAQLEAVVAVMNQQDIFPRRYFYPSLNQLNYVKSASCPVSESIAARVLCLPLFYDLAAEDQHLICDLLTDTIAR